VTKMTSIIKSANELTEDEINRLYDIHKKNYVNKGIGLERPRWEKNLGILYHKKLKKYVQLINYRDNTNRIDGYNIFTEATNFEGKIFSKIIEGGVNTLHRKNTKNAFIFMLQELIAKGNKNSIYYLAETGTKHTTVLNLLYESGFHNMKNRELADGLMKGFISDTPFKLTGEENNLKIQRKTAIDDNFVGYLITNMGI